jgi:hypothetical protein
MTGVLPECGGGGISRGGQMTPLERSSRSLRSPAGGACPSVSVFGVRSRSDMVGCAHAPAVIAAATMPADIHVSARVARATACILSGPCLTNRNAGQRNRVPLRPRGVVVRCGKSMRGEGDRSCKLVAAGHLKGGGAGSFRRR